MEGDTTAEASGPGLRELTASRFEHTNEDMDHDDMKTPIKNQKQYEKLDRSSGQRCCSSCRYYYEPAVAVLMPIAALIDLILGAAAGWQWGICLGVVGVFLGVTVAYETYRARHKSSARLVETHYKVSSTRTACFTAYEASSTRTGWLTGGAKRVFPHMLVFAKILFPYVLVTALVQVMPSSRHPQWHGLGLDGFPTSCPPAAQNCVRLGNGTDIYAAGATTDMTPPILPAPTTAVLDQVAEWVRAQGGVVVFRSNQVLRATFATFFMGYQDDLAALAYCMPAPLLEAPLLPAPLLQAPLLHGQSRLQLNLQSQSRVGIGDMGVNAHRLQNLIHFLEDACPSSREQSVFAVCQGQCL